MTFALCRVLAAALRHNFCALMCSIVRRLNCLDDKKNQMKQKDRVWMVSILMGGVPASHPGACAKYLNQRANLGSVDITSHRPKRSTGKRWPALIQSFYAT